LVPDNGHEELTMRTLIGFACAAWLLIGSGSAVGQPFNECGCYRDDSGACKCARKSKCGCPGECEPVGCEAKREKQAEREAEAELKRIAAKEKKKAAEAAKAAKEKQKAEKAAEKSAEQAKKAEQAKRAGKAGQEALQLPDDKK
jgi:hypothetical protein